MKDIEDKGLATVFASCHALVYRCFSAVRPRLLPGRLRHVLRRGTGAVSSCKSAATLVAEAFLPSLAKACRPPARFRRPPATARHRRPTVGTVPWGSEHPFSWPPTGWAQGSTVQGRTPRSSLSHARRAVVPDTRVRCAPQTPKPTPPTRWWRGVCTNGALPRVAQSCTPLGTKEHDLRALRTLAAARPPHAQAAGWRLGRGLTLPALWTSTVGM